MKKLISAILAILILGSGMGIGTDTLVAAASPTPDAKPVSYDMGTATYIYKTLKMGDLDSTVVNPKGSFQFEFVDGNGPHSGTVAFDGVSSYFTYTPTDAASFISDTFDFRICRPAEKGKPRDCGAKSTATINGDSVWTIGDESVGLSYFPYTDVNGNPAVAWQGSSSNFIQGMATDDMTSFKIKASSASDYTDVPLDLNGQSIFHFIPDSGTPQLGYHLLKDAGGYYFQFFTMSEPAIGTTYNVSYEALDGTHTQYGTFTISY